MKPLKDWRGTPIKVGSRILAPQRSGKVLFNVEATVAAVTPRELDVWDDHRLKKHRLATPAYSIKVKDVRWPQEAPSAVPIIETIRALHGVTVIG